MGKKIFCFLMVVLLATIITVAASIPTSAAVGDQTVEYSGDYVITHTVVKEVEDANGITQTIEHRWIPRSQYNGGYVNNNVINLYPNNNWQWNQNGQQKQQKQQQNDWNNLSSSQKIERLRNADRNSANDIKGSAENAGWIVTSDVETYADQSRISSNVEFYTNKIDYADAMAIAFVRTTSVDNYGNIATKYYNKGTEYSATSIKDMFKKYGRKR